MRTAYAVIGANFGDEGKGLVTDWLAHRVINPVVVRFNGGAQAGHTVVTPKWERHVFHHYGAGGFAKALTYLGPRFVCNPMLWKRELEELRGRGIPLRILVNPKCQITTPWDMIVNQFAERARGDKRHGSCGIGFNHTIQRALRGTNTQYGRVVGDDWWNGGPTAAFIRDHYFPGWLEWAGVHGDLKEEAMWIGSTDLLMNDFAEAMSLFRDMSVPCARLNPEHEAIIFEGAQGLLLDMNRQEYFPHVTHSRTGLANVIELAEQWGIEKINAYYVSRTYLTRHGRGFLPNEDLSMSFPDDTNVDNQWQERLRFAPLGIGELFKRIIKDKELAIGSGVKVQPHLVFTHHDQMPIELSDQMMIQMCRNVGFQTLHISMGPTRDHIMPIVFPNQ